MSFTNTADPLFMVGAVAVGMFRIGARPVLLWLTTFQLYSSALSLSTTAGAKMGARTSRRLTAGNPCCHELPMSCIQREARTIVHSVNCWVTR